MPLRPRPYSIDQWNKNTIRDASFDIDHYTYDEPGQFSEVYCVATLQPINMIQAVLVLLGLASQTLSTDAALQSMIHNLQKYLYEICSTGYDDVGEDDALTEKTTKDLVGIGPVTPRKRPPLCALSIPAIGMKGFGTVTSFLSLQTVFKKGKSAGSDPLAKLASALDSVRESDDQWWMRSYAQDPAFFHSRVCLVVGDKWLSSIITGWLKQDDNQPPVIVNTVPSMLSQAHSTH